MRRSAPRCPRHPDAAPRPRGAARREALLEAVLRIVAEVGADAVTHRRVAEVAGLPLASTTYWFDSKEHLLTAALELAAERDIARRLQEFAGRTRRCDADMPTRSSLAVAADPRSARREPAGQPRLADRHLRAAARGRPPPGAARGRPALDRRLPRHARAPAGAGRLAPTRGGRRAAAGRRRRPADRAAGRRRRPPTWRPGCAGWPRRWWPRHERRSPTAALRRSRRRQQQRGLPSTGSSS